MDSPEQIKDRRFTCSGSVDPSVIKLEIDSIVADWVKLEPLYAAEFSEARQKVGPCETSHTNIDLIQSEWIQQGGQTWQTLDSMLYLPESILTFERILFFLRFIENIIVDARLPAVLGYRSGQYLVHLLPTAKGYRELMISSYSIMIFQEKGKELLDRWCFFAEASSLCVILRGTNSHK